jgi:hypothetical protein
LDGGSGSGVQPMARQQTVVETSISHREQVSVRQQRFMMASLRIVRALRESYGLTTLRR